MGPKGFILEFQASETKALVIDRPDLDRSIAEKASEAGANVLHGHTYLGHEKIEGGIEARIRNKSEKNLAFKQDYSLAQMVHYLE